MNFVLRGWAPAVILTVCGSATGVLADEVRVVAKAGDRVTVPGQSGVFTINRIASLSGGIYTPCAAGDGDVAVTIQLAGPGITSSNSNSVIHIGPSAKTLVARVAAAAPGTTSTFTSLGQPMMNERGEVVLPAWVSGSYSSGYWGFTSQGTSLLLREGMNAPNVSGAITSVSDSQVARYAPSLLLTFKSNLMNSTLPSGLNRMLGRATASSSSTSQQLLAYPTMGAPGASGASFASDLQRIGGDAGGAVVYSSLTGTGVTSANNQGIWAASAASDDYDNLRMVARTGSAAPGMVSGATFSTLFNTSGAKPILANDGDVIFSARTGGTAVDSGIWLAPANGTTPRLLVKGSQAAPGLGAGVIMGSLFAPMPTQSIYTGDPALGSSADALVFFSAIGGSGVSTSNNRVLWRMNLASPGSQPVMLGRGGMQAPGAAPGVTIVNSAFGDNCIVNRRGDALVYATLQGPGVDLSNDTALVRYRDGEARMLVREGDVIPNTDGLRIMTTTLPCRMYFNDLGQAAFFAWLTRDPAGITGDYGFVGIDEDGGLRVLAMPNLQLQTQSDGAVRLSTALSAHSTHCLTNDGEFVFTAGVFDSPSSPEMVFAVRMAPGVSVPTCRADWNRSGLISEQDLFDFLADYFANRADMNGDGFTTLVDLFDFIAAWHARC